MFISETLIVKNNEVILQAKKENLNRAIVTTPYDVVKFMVSKSLEKFTNKKSPEEIKKCENNIAGYIMSKSLKNMDVSNESIRYSDLMEILIKNEN